MADQIWQNVQSVNLTQFVVLQIKYFKNINVGIQFNGKQYCHKQVYF